MHKEHCGCGCGHTHEHNHTESCGCGHTHEHNHTESCGCGHTHEHAHPDHCGCHNEVPLEHSELSQDQMALLAALMRHGYLPIARFCMMNSEDEEIFAVALEPVYIVDSADSMEIVKETGELFTSLADRGLITLDYDEPLKGYAYAEYETSELYAYFVDTMKEAAGQKGFVFNTPLLEKGSVALTQAGQDMLNASMEKREL